MGVGAITDGTSDGVEQRVTEAVGRWSASLLRTARRHTICDDDAQDAYQRTLELYLVHAERLDPARVGGWLHTVCRNEALAIRRARAALDGSAEVDELVAPDVASPEERAVDAEQLERAAEALGSLKPAELRALWLQAHGLAYKEIAVATGWSYTKVNRCLTEGRRTFLRRYAGLEAGEGCGPFEVPLARVAAGELRAGAVPGLRAHLRHCGWCRAAVRPAAQATELRVLLPVAGVPVLGGGAARGEAGQWVVRVVEAVSDLASSSSHRVADAGARTALRTQTLVEAATASGGKAAAVAASAAALAGGGAVAVEEVREAAHGRAQAAERRAAAGRAPAPDDLVRLAPASSTVAGVAIPRERPVLRVPVRPRAAPGGARPAVRRRASADGRRRVTSRKAARTEFRTSARRPASTSRQEFGTATAAPAPGPVAPAPAPVAPAPAPAPGGGFEGGSGSSGGGEFGG